MKKVARYLSNSQFGNELTPLASFQVYYGNFC